MSQDLTPKIPLSLPPFALFPRRLLSILPERRRFDETKERVTFERVSETDQIVTIEPIERAKWLDDLLNAD